MSNLATVNGNGQLADPLSLWNPTQIELIKTQIAKDCSDQELMLFGQVCQRTGLDPFARQIYAISRYDKSAPGGKKMSIQTSIDGYRLIADRTGKYAGSETFWCGTDGVWLDVWLDDMPPAAAKTLVYKTGSDKAFVGVAKFSGYVQTYKDKQTGQMKPTGLWEKMPDLMIGKCSEALALRKAFPAELSGLYTREEMMQAENEAIDVQPIAQTSSGNGTGYISEKQLARYMAISNKAGWTQEEQKFLLTGNYGISTRKKIPRDQYEKICNDLEDADLLAAIRQSLQADSSEAIDAEVVSD